MSRNDHYISKMNAELSTIRCYKCSLDTKRLQDMCDQLEIPVKEAILNRKKHVQVNNKIKCTKNRICNAKTCKKMKLKQILNSLKSITRRYYSNINQLTGFAKRPKKKSNKLQNFTVSEITSPLLLLTPNASKDNIGVNIVTEEQPKRAITVLQNVIVREPEIKECHSDSDTTVLLDKSHFSEAVINEFTVKLNQLNQPSQSTDIQRVEMELQKESSDVGSSIEIIFSDSHLDNFQLTNASDAKIDSICERVQTWKSFGVPWINELHDNYSVGQSLCRDIQITSDNECSKEQRNNFWDSPQFSPIPHTFTKNKNKNDVLKQRYL